MKVPGMLLSGMLLAMVCWVGTLPADALAAEDGGAAVYQQEVRPLTTLECARCHYSVFAGIRDHGGRHQLECGFCHQVFHSWRPGIPWSEVVPQCATCHGEFHGGDFKACLECHADPHAPQYSLVDMDVLGRNCATCHAGQAQEVNRYPSAHSDVACSECHADRHGHIPACLACHAEPHTPFAGNAGCLACHPVHAPLEIKYGDNVVNETCAVCHGEAQKALRKGATKHGQLFCVYCHAERHRSVPQCRDCHAQPHNEKLLQRFGGCADCHGDPHALKLAD